MEPHDRQPPAEHFGGDKRAERQHILGFAKDQGSRRAACQREIEQHAGAAAGAAARGHHQDCAGETFAVQRMMDIDDLAGGGIHPTPETECFLRGDDAALRRATHDAASRCRVVHITLGPYARGS